MIELTRCGFSSHRVGSYCVDLDRQKTSIFYKLDPEIATFDMWFN